jgi:Na+/H+ antiporter NhaD/arsenite permease-like protein
MGFRWAATIGVCLVILAGSAALAEVKSAPTHDTSTEVASTDGGAADSKDVEKHVGIGHELPYWTIAPFAILLLCIAVLPLARPHWWEHNHNKGIVAALLAVPLAFYLYFQFGHEGLEKLEHSGLEYVSFILLLASLYIISGGIYIKGSLAGTPAVNTLVLAFGAIIASIIGTTGASVLLIRPLLRANAPRQDKAHVFVFFIFVVSNCGGLLTPLGDPPLFLGFLKGVPFDWTLRNLWPQWLTVNALLLVIFFIYDQIVFNREEARRPGSQEEEVKHHEPLGAEGLHNFLFLAIIVAIIFCAGSGIGTNGEPWPYGWQELAMLATAVASYAVTAPTLRAKNRFTFTPIIEVAVLFAGIFVTMIPALQILNAKGPELGVNEPWQFFWASGALSSFLDNAPTYLTFAATACGLEGIALEGRYLAEFLNLTPKPGEPSPVEILAAISCGAVFMGANTYIGNGPNFMVKAIAEENGVKMPSFFGYMAYSGCILIPIFVVVTFAFFR